MSEIALKICLVDCSSSKVPNIKNMLLRCGCRVSVVELAEANRCDFTVFDAVVISGGPKLFTDPKQVAELQRQFQFIECLTLPTLGICLGHQAIGLAYGSKIYRDVERRDSETIYNEIGHPLFEGLSCQFEVGTDHCEGIDVPANFKLIASSANYPVEAIADDHKKLYGVQFHPEVSGRVGEKIFKNFCQLIASEPST